jgi:hypothetical protein
MKGWVVILLVFALGGATGAAINNMYRLWPTAPITTSTRNPDYFDMLKSELSLDKDQAETIGTIINEMRNQYKSVCADVRPRYDVLRENARARMRTVLTPEQQERFDLIVTREDCNCPEFNRNSGQ